VGERERTFERKQFRTLTEEVYIPVGYIVAVAVTTNSGKLFEIRKRVATSALVEIHLTSSLLARKLYTITNNKTFLRGA